MTNAQTKVLMIEDLRVAQPAAYSIFQQLDCNIHIVSSGSKAIQQIMMKNFDIIFMDIGLPDTNGFDLAQIFRHLQRKNRTPLIAVTANSHAELGLRSKEAGCDDFIIKPLSIEVVRYVLSKYLSQR